MEDTQRIVKCGNLSLHTPGGFFKKRWHPKYLVLYDGSKSGIKRLELFDSEIKFKKQNPAKIIPLVDCVRVVTCQRQKTTYTFEVRTSDQFYLLAGQSFQDMTDWVNCLRLVAFGQSQQQQQQSGGGIPTCTATTTTAAGNGNNSAASTQLVAAAASAALAKRQLTASNQNRQQQTFDVLLETRRMQQQQVSAASRGGAAAATASDAVTSTEQVAGSGQKGQQQHHTGVMTASQAAAAAASALAKTRQRQPSLLGSCKPQPPNDSPFIQHQQQQQQQQRLSSSTSSIGDGLGAGSALGAVLNSIGSMDTLTPTVRGQLISAAPPTIESKLATSVPSTQTPAITNQFKSSSSSSAPTIGKQHTKQQQPLKIQATLDEEEENMLYCSIEDNPSEHNYRVKVIETELSLRCQLKCYQLTAPTLISEQYEELNLFRLSSSSNLNKLNNNNNNNQQQQPQIVTFYQLIIGPQELTLLNDYATAAAANYSPNKQQGLWSWPYQCIRRYGFDKDNCFMFEAGRKCTSGPGQFIVQTPKAYLIYQDVVKFVNELRTVSTATGGGGGGVGEPVNQNTCTVTATTATGNTNGANQTKQLVVTQIPVAWTPNEQQHNQQDSKLNNLEINQLPDSLESRKHFFNALRQLDSSSTNQEQDQRAPDKTEVVSSALVAADDMQQHLSRESPSSPSCSSSSSSNSSKRLNSPTVAGGVQEKLKGADSKSETDESGYDQGDDSVDSGSRSFKEPSPTTGLIVASRKRQANDSMSSASSTSSGGSPGQSISRSGRANVRVHSATANNNNNGQGPAKRPPISGLNMKSETNKTSVAGDSKQQQLGLHHLITDEVLGSAGQTTNGFNLNPREFEANLIRDVYSEITKLHAKFAVTSSGSADDSMSSHSSQVETSELLNKSGEEEEEEEEEEGERDEFDDDFDDICEPTYSNVRLLPPNGNRQREGRRTRNREQDFEEHFDYDQENRPYVQRQSLASSRHEQHCQSQQLTSNNINTNQLDYLSSSRPLYPTTLNPIPEFGELAAHQQPTPPPVAPKPQRFLSNDTNNSLNHRLPPDSSTNKLTNRCHAPQTTSDIPTLIEKGLPRARLATRSRTNEKTNQKSTNTDSQSKLRGQQQDHLVKNRISSSVQSKTTNKMMNNNGKLRPTNHYVINDVQYAKISRNLHSNFESCL